MNLIADPIPALIRRIAIPASVGMFFQTMYNFVDIYFAGQVSVEALAALTFSFPVFFIVLAVGNGLSQGTTGLLANALGAGDINSARRYFCQALLLYGGLVVMLTTAGLIWSPFLFQAQGATSTTLALSLEYMEVIMAGSGFFLLQSLLNAELNSRGNTRVYRDTLIVGFFANCLLNPWFLYGGFGLPAMGIAGLAWATIVCQVGACAYLFYHISRGEVWQGVRRAHFKPDGRLLRQLATQSLPAAFNMLTVAVGIFVIQYFIAKFSTAAVAGYGIATRIEQMLLLPTMGLNYAVISLVGQNNGAGRMDRVQKTWRTTLKYGLTMMLVGGMFLWFTKSWLMGLFTQDPEVIARGVDYLGIAAATLASYVILFQTVMLLQGLKRPKFAIWIGLFRQIFAPLLVFNALAVWLECGLWGIWWGITFITWSAALLAFGYGRRILKQVSPSSLPP